MTDRFGPASADTTPRPPRAGKLLGLGALALLATLALGEVALRIAVFFVQGRAGSGSLAAHRILCVGDSHTFGAGIPPDQSYPAYLQKFLDERAPHAYSVINLGVPGMNTAQLVRRLPNFVSLYKPDVVIVWVGVNNAWNRADMDLHDAGWIVRLDGLATRSRLYRLIRVRLHDRKLERDLLLGDANQLPRVNTLTLPLKRGDQTVALRRGGRLERIHHVRVAFHVDQEMKQRTRRDFEAMASYALAAGVRMVFITYPINQKVYAAVNELIRETARDRALSVIESPLSLQRVPQAQRVFIWAAHPTGPIYLEIARDVADTVLAPDAAPAAGRPSK